MANLFTPECPGSGYWFIDREDCIGDSLTYINANTNYLGCKITDLYTIIDRLSSNMDQLLNVPYARLVELPGKDEPISTLRDITGSSGTNRSSPAQLIFPKSRDITLTRNLTLIDTPTTYIDEIGITKNSNRSFRFSSTGTYEIYVQSPHLSLHNSGGWAAVNLRLKGISGTTILAGTTVNIDMNRVVAGPELRGRFTVPSTATDYFIELRRNQAGQNYGLCAALPDVQGVGALFNVEFWKIS